jgi:Zn-dependent peptidase ImmA (M78 family)
MSEVAPVIDLMELADLGQPLKIAAEIHRQIRAQYGSVPLRMPLEALAGAVGIVGVKEFATDAFEGTLVVKDGVGAIGLREGMRSGRRNFTLGHELGHFLIPSHRFSKTRFECAKRDMTNERGKASAWDNRPVQERIEVEANEFAAALIVPAVEFGHERRKLGAACDVTHVRHLAEAFDVSQEMMAGLYVRAADEPIAVVTSCNGEVRRVIPAPGFPYLGLRRGAPVPKAAMTHSFRSSEATGAISSLDQVPTDAWLEKQGRVSALYEQVFLQEEGWAMTLLAIDQEEVDEEADDSNWSRRSARS